MRIIYLVIVVSISLMVLNSGLETVAKSVAKSNAQVSNIDRVIDQAVRGK